MKPVARHPCFPAAVGRHGSSCRPQLSEQLGCPKATGPERERAHTARLGGDRDGCSEEAEAVVLLGQAHAHPLLIGQHSLVYFK